MGLHSFLERLGFVRLRDFGLLLTPDRRIVTTRQVLDDGFGAVVVGWEGNDLAMMELPAKAPEAAAIVTMGPARPLPPRPPVMPVATPPAAMPILAAPIAAAPIAPAPIAPAPSPPPVITQAVPTAAPVAASPATASADAAPEMTEDEWEWEIAMARARAETPVAPIASVLPPPAMPVAKAPTTNTTSQWLTSEPLKGQWQDDTAIRSVTRLARASEQQLAQTPRTIIPVPTLPVALDPRLVVDEITRQLPMPRHRAARGTNPQPHVANDDTSTAVNVRTAQRR